MTVLVKSRLIRFIKVSATIFVMSIARKAAKGAFVVFLMILLTSIFSYLLRLLLARNLTQQEYGLVYAVFALFGLLSILQHLGLNESLVKHIAEYRIKKALARIKGSIILVLILQLSTAFILALLGWLLSGWLAANYFKMPEAAAVIRIYAISILLSPLELVFIYTFQGFQRMNIYSIVNFLRMLFILVSSALLLKAGTGVLSAPMAYVLVYVLPFVVYWPLLVKKVFKSFRRVKAVMDGQLVKSLVSYGIPVMITAAASIVITYTDTIMLTYYRSLEEVALYNAAMPTSRMLWMIAQAMTIVLFPLSAELWIKNKQYLRQGLAHLYKYSALLVLPFSLVVFVNAKLILRIFFGQQYEEGAFVLMALSAGAIFYTIALINTSVINGMGRPKANTAIAWTASIANFFGNWLLIPKYGIKGASISTVAAFALMFLLTQLYIKKYLKARTPVLYWLKTFFSAILFLATALVLRRALKMPALSEAIVVLIAAGIVYTAAAFALRLVSIAEIKKAVAGAFIK